MNNISKYIAINEFLLLEVEMNKSEELLDLTGIDSAITTTKLGTVQYFNSLNSLGITNNSLIFNSEPINVNRTSWFCSPEDTIGYYNYFGTTNIISVPNYVFDIIRIHIISGYNFDDISGFLLQLRAKGNDGTLKDLSNFTWINQVNGNSAIKFSSNALFLSNRFYDKYIELKIPSVGKLGSDTVSPLAIALDIQTLSDLYITYSTIADMDKDTYIVSELISLQLPITSAADNFNCLITQSTAGDFIEFYATWKDTIIGEYIGDIESGRIKLYTSNNPNDNYEEFTNTYGTESAKWVVIHELQIWEQIPGANILTQKYSFTQADNFMAPNYFRPVIKNSDIASSYTVEYVCRLMNRMDGTQIIRKASFASTDPKKYGKFFTRINVDNFIPYKIFNRIEGESHTAITGIAPQKTKFVKVFYDTTHVLLNTGNEILPQGTGPLFLKNGDGTYVFKFDKLNTDAGNEYSNVDLSGSYNYALLFILDDNSKIEISPTYSSNMNTTLGELEFKIMENQVYKLLKQVNNTYSIIVKNSDGTQYTFYEGLFYSYKSFDKVLAQFNSIIGASSVNYTIAYLQNQIRVLTEENIALKAK